MNPNYPRETAADSSPRCAPGADELETVRELLFGKEKQRLDLLQERIQDPGRQAHDVSQVLARAVTIASERDSQFSSALTPTVELALKTSVKRDPAILVNAIFPIIGPAIRASIAESLKSLVESLNVALEHSLSARGFKWRLEAIRTGKSFGEVVLTHTLLYRVEQVFLIHKETGLLLQRVTAPNVQSEDPDLISAMLTAIRDFARDSFRMNPEESLHAFEVGGLTVWVESSPFVALAAVIRGHAPSDYRLRLQTALERIHQEEGAALEAFQGDTSGFESTFAKLESCLDSKFSHALPKRSSAKLVFVIVLLLVPIVLWVGSWMRERGKWADFLNRLKAEPGIIVTEARKDSTTYFVSGLRDPMATEPAGLISQFGLDPGKFVHRWESYHSLSREFVLKRAMAVLDPPQGVTLTLQDGVLRAKGRASSSWIDAARLRAVTIPGIQELNDKELEEETQSLVSIRQREIENTALYFEDGLRLVSGQEGVLELLRTQLDELRKACNQSGSRVRVFVIGHADKTGSEAQNLRLSQERAEEVANLLIGRGMPAQLISSTGLGSAEPRRADPLDQDQLKNRRVTFRVTIEPGARP